jgi:hypothetical protein
MHFAIIGEISHTEIIAKGRGIRSLPRLRAAFGGSNWRKMKGLAVVELQNGARRRAEIHWYEAHGIGRKWLKIKRFLD